MYNPKYARNRWIMDHGKTSSSPSSPPIFFMAGRLLTPRPRLLGLPAADSWSVPDQSRQKAVKAAGDLTRRGRVSLKVPGEDGRVRWLKPRGLKMWREAAISDAHTVHTWNSSHGLVVRKQHLRMTNLIFLDQVRWKWHTAGLSKPEKASIQYTV